MSRESDAIRAVPLADIARRLGMVPSGGRWKPCPDCGADRVAVGERVISCFACSLRLDAVSAARRDGRTWEQAAEWAGVYVGPGWVAPPKPFRWDDSPVWTWDTRRNPPRFESLPLPWGGPGDAPFEPDPHGMAWARFRRDERPEEVNPWAVVRNAASVRILSMFPGPGECVEECAALHGAAAVLGWDVVGEVWE